MTGHEKRLYKEHATLAERKARYGLTDEELARWVEIRWMLEVFEELADVKAMSERRGAALRPAIILLRFHSSVLVNMDGLRANWIDLALGPLPPELEDSL